jgi:hypothetical protein
VIIANEAFASTFGAAGVGVGVATATEAAGLAVVAGVVGVLSQAPTNRAAVNTPADNETLRIFFFITIDFSFSLFRGHPPAEHIWD